MFKNLIQFWKGKDFLSEVLEDFNIMLEDSEKMFKASYDVLIENKKDPAIEQDIIKNVIKAVMPPELMDDNIKYYVNATGRFVIGGPVSDTGFTGRKILVDTYGGVARHGGGAFSGKDPTKVDRSAAYMARYIAKNMVAADIAERLEIQIAYVIGVAHPLSVSVETFGTGIVDAQLIKDLITVKN